MRTAAIAAIFTLGFGAGAWATARARQETSLPAERVSGIGGVFFKARDPKSLGAWYRQALGVDTMAGSQFAKFQWRDRDDSTRVASTAWALFPSASNYFPGSLMINYRVRNLEAMLAQLKAVGVTVDGKITEDANGKFAWILDPEGNKVELWEPKTGS